MKVNLTDRFIKSRKPAPAGKRALYLDAQVPGLALRITDTGHKSMVLIARYPMQPTNPAPRTLGDFGVVSLAQAREKARHWLGLISQGVDPKVEAERQRAAEQRKLANSFAAVAVDFLERHVKGLTKEADCRRTIGEFVRRWGARPIADITANEIAAAIRTIVNRGHKATAHNAFSDLRRMYSWAIATGEYGLEFSPTDRLKPTQLIGRRTVRNRVLNNNELRIVWSAAERMGYPYRDLIRLLILAGQRLTEISDLRWSEIDLDQALTTIPAARMKGKVAHEVPLPPMALALLKSLPRFQGGDFIFTTRNGKKPIGGFGNSKLRLDRIITQLRGADGALEHWTYHDLRRTMRTHLSALPVQDLVRELVIAHARPGLHKVYDLHAYQAEKRQCLVLWEQRLASILAPPKPAEVADLADVRAKRSRRPVDA
jgi:integrase